MRVLIVEDEVKLAAYLRRGLEREGYAVDVAGNGEDGYWMASSNPYDAIVLDIMLPKRNGYQVCGDLRRDGIWTPILMLTAKQGELDEAEALDARLRALLRRGPAERPPVLSAGNLVLDPAGRRCSFAGTDVELTPTEFCVLQVLMRRPGDVVSKSTILESCWDWAYEGDPNIVEVYVRRLRRKIDESFDHKVIHTVRGAGYRVAADDG